MKLICYSFLVIFLLGSLNSSYSASGGPLKPEQAAYDVNYYFLDISIFPETQSIDASLLCRVRIIESIDSLMLDLDEPFTVSTVLLSINEGEYTEVGFNHFNELLNIDIPEDVMEDDMVSVEIYYSGAPRIADNPPWGVGFVWETTPDGAPWLAVACEDEGGDIWWPCKDHPSDEPDSMNINFTVPNPLMCVSNGQYMGVDDNGDNTSTYKWFISTPINNYNVTFYAAEFMLIEDEYESTIGNTIPFRFWVLPESYEQAVDYMDVFLQEFNFLEEICGPFPFGTDKHGWAHAPYWGMEHQSIIAYGHNFTTNNWGYDYIHYHELAHEWWGNLITAKDWSDIWIHEGIATYTEALYVERMSGLDDYLQFMRQNRPGDNHSYPLAPLESMTAGQAFGYLNSYGRGAAVMHTLRYHLGDDLFFELMKRWAYPDPNDFDNTNGRLCRILSTEDMKNQAEEVTGIDLYPFFSVFMREASYPDLIVEREYNQTVFQWQTENNIPLDINIPILINGEEYTVEMTNGQGSIEMLIEDDLEIDPDKWILMANPTISVSLNELDKSGAVVKLEQNYPNPFSDFTQIEYSILNTNYVSLKVYNLVGKEVLSLVDEDENTGVYQVNIDGKNLESGIYFYTLKIGNAEKTKKMLVLD
ncbi:M1 family aminopeptidase [Lentimicrobium sp. S6]|uniref:M1 family aminopeptidase n=1 Tax=Lentimicrobium sp. S6 TaxID=2735872 RepID=UPI0015567BD8|nr:M1 family aminopeptidase [Lentimicrobium sp. S6]NPD45076.1 T9SS type A sorting domain-containing protein [Lentimicrobium sp. S6]